MTALILVGLIPFAAIGILIGHLVTIDSIGPAMGGTTALLGAARRRLVPDHRTASDARRSHEALPSYWLVQASHVGLGGHGWGPTGWAVVAAWTRRCDGGGRPRLPPRHPARLTSGKLCGRMTR